MIPWPGALVANHSIVIPCLGPSVKPSYRPHAIRGMYEQHDSFELGQTWDVSHEVIP